MANDLNYKATMAMWVKRTIVAAGIVGAYLAFTLPIAIFFWLGDAHTTGPIRLREAWAFALIGLCWIPIAAYGAFEATWWNQRRFPRPGTTRPADGT